MLRWTGSALRWTPEERREAFCRLVLPLTRAVETARDWAARAHEMLPPWREAAASFCRLIGTLWREGRPVAVLILLCLAVGCVLAPVAVGLGAVFLLAGASALVTFGLLAQRSNEQRFLGLAPKPRSE